MTDEQIENEYPTGVKQIGRWHDVPNGNSVIIVETDNQENLTSWIMSWSSMCTFPIVKPVVDDQTGRKLVKTHSYSIVTLISILYTGDKNV